jgi:hypothetical protein
LNLGQFSINGNTYLSGRLGAGLAAVPFSQIRVMAFSPAPKGLKAELTLTDRTQMNLILEKGLTAYGKIKAGTYQVLLEQLKKIEIQSVAEKKKEKDRG